jgi:hypothetical protein
MHRGRALRGPALVAGLVLAALLSLAPAPAAQGQEGGDDTTTSTVPVPVDDIIPRPNSGSEPREAGDRGGALQVAVLAGIVVGVGVIVALVVRESRRARRSPR